MVVAPPEIIAVVLGSLVLSYAVIIAVWPRLRDIRRLIPIGSGCAIGIVVWNVGLNVTNATSLNVDSDVFGLSVQDVGSGVLAGVGVLAALVIADRRLTRTGIGIAALVGMLAIVVDRFA